MAANNQCRIIHPVIRNKEQVAPRRQIKMLYIWKVADRPKHDHDSGTEIFARKHL